MDSRVAVLTSLCVDDQPIRFTKHIEEESVRHHTRLLAFNRNDPELYKTRHSLDYADTIKFLSEIYPLTFNAVWSSLISLKNIYTTDNSINIFDVNSRFRKITCVVQDMSPEKRSDGQDDLCATVSLPDEMFGRHDWFAEVRDATIKTLHIVSDDNTFKDFILVTIVGSSGVVLETVAFECALLENFSDRWRLLKCWLDSHALDDGFATEEYILEKYRCKMNGESGPYIKPHFLHIVAVGFEWDWINKYTAEISELLNESGCSVSSWSYAADTIGEWAAYLHINKYGVMNVMGSCPKESARKCFELYSNELIWRFSNYKNNKTHDYSLGSADFKHDKT